MTRPSLVYRCTDAEGALLYVGCTYNLEQRVASHRSVSPWWADVARTDSQAYATRTEALAVERLAIVEERPRYNLVGRSPDRLEWSAEDYAAVLRVLRAKPTTAVIAKRISRLEAEVALRFAACPA